MRSTEEKPGSLVQEYGRKNSPGARDFSSIELPSFLRNLDPRIYESDNYVVLDWETTNLDKGFAGNPGNRIVLATWLLGKSHRGVRQQANGSVYTQNGVNYKFGSEFEQGELVEAIRSADFIVAHFAKFELQWLTRCGVDISRILPWDTVLGEYVLAGNRRRPFDLDTVARRRGFGSGKESLVSSLIASGVCPSEIPEQWLVEYGCQDTSLCHRIFLQQREELSQSLLLPVMYTRCITTPVLADIELNGLQLDEKLVKEEYEAALQSFTAANEDLFRFTKGINLGSPKQVAEFLYDKLGFEEVTRNGKADRTPANGRRTDAETIERLVCVTPEQTEFAEKFGVFGQLEFRLNFLEKLLACCNEEGGLLYASINQAVAQTHRLASSGKKYKVQIQNIARDLKKLFRARHPEWLVGEADGAQLEFRVAAHLGRDPVALADIRNPNFDAHYQTAEIILKKVRELISEDERSDIKPFTFKPLYGGMSGTAEERAYYRFFQEKYNGIYRTQEQWSYIVLRDKHLTTEWGLKFYWPDTKLEVSAKGGKGYIKNRTSIFNYPVQSFATAEIIPIALVYTWHYFKALGLKGFLVNTVHDSVIAELPPEEEEIFREICEYCFTSLVFSFLQSVYGVRFTVPLGTETKVGTHWSKGKKRKYDLDPEDYFRAAA
jgi:DNA polymerase I-like protein with 3'-5' exonuclease and polymerase domains